MSRFTELNVTVLGRFVAHMGSRRLAMGPPRQRAVLALLIVHSGHVISTQQITEEIWGFAPPGRSTATLQTYVSRLRRSLTDAHPGVDTGNPVAHRACGYQLLIDRDCIDSYRFEEAVAAGQESLRHGHFAVAQQRLIGALELWHGTPYAELADYRFAADEAARLEQIRLNAVTGHAEATMALGQHERVIAALDDEVRHHPLHEPIVRQLMFALYRSGRQADALHVYERTRRQLADELGIDASNELQGLYGAILRHDPTLKANGGQSISVSAGDRDRPSANPPCRRALAGRDQELSKLERAAASVRNGCGRTIVLAGEAGIGKTRLLIELDRGLHDQPIDVVWGSGVQVDGAPAHWLWAQVLRQLATIRPAAFRRATADSAPLLGPLLPEHIPAPEPATVPLAHQADTRFRMHDAVCRILLELASEHPLTIVLDDLQWADPPSLELFRLLAGRVRHASLLVVAAARDTEPDFTPTLRHALASVLREPTSDTVQLRGIGLEAAGALAAAVGGREIAPALRNALHARTNGNPFFLTQLLSSLEQHSPVTKAEVDRLLLHDVPFGVREVLHHRLSKLDADTLTLLQCCAVIGTDIPVPLLSSLYGADPSMYHQVEVAVRANLLKADPERIDVLHFTNALVRDVLYEELASAEGAWLHALAAEALVEQRTTPDEYAEQIAMHSWHAASVLDTAVVLERLAAAAEQAEHRLAYREAETWLRRAVELAQTIPSDPAIAGWERRVQSRLGQLLTATHGYPDAAAGQAFSREEDLSQVTGVPDHPAVLLGVCVAHVAAGRYGMANEVAERLRGIGKRTGNVIAVVGGRYGRGMVRYVRGDVAGALRAFTSAIRHADDMIQHYQVDELRRIFQFDPRVICRAYELICHWLVDDPAKSTARLSEIAALTKGGTPLERTLFLYMDALTGVLSHDVDRAWRSSSSALNLIEAHNLRYRGDMTSVLHGWALAYRGRPDDGITLISSALRRLDQAETAVRLPLNLGLLAMAQHRSGYLGAARRSIYMMTRQIETRGEYLYLHPRMPFTGLREQLG
ncbi:BTAD domain-containing putative transcriptional regulator [Nocardia sp. CA-128927]|uniref:BTAD domain-containing putative transcriptional regulator n=1 Tax=Nocardia sp. CA-128927 TaxID=3239975 RepID=UPI003D95124C